jgi:hypothetical protein
VEMNQVRYFLALRDDFISRAPTPRHRRQLASGSGDQGPGLKSAAAKEEAKPARRPKPRGRGTSPVFATASAVRTGTDYLPR